jgi:hypothetical protein
MRFLGILYGFVLAVAVVASIALMSREATGLLIWGTFGFGSSVFFFPTVVPYLVAFAPLMFRWVRPGSGLLLAVAWIAAFGFGPGLASSIAASRWTREVQSGQKIHNIHGAARAVEVRYPVTLIADPGVFSTGYCLSLCRELLLSGQIDRIRFLASGPRRTEGRVYRIGHGAECAQTRLVGGDACVVTVREGDDASDAPPELTIAVASQVGGSDAPAFSLAQINRRSQYTATYRDQIVYNDVALQATVYTLPTLVVAGEGRMALWPSSRAIHPVVLADVFRALGYRV